MLIIAILLSLVCPIVLRKYDLLKYENTFKARGQTSVNKHNPTECGLSSFLRYLKIDVNLRIGLKKCKCVNVP